jgi:hypothetical protein
VDRKQARVQFLFFEKPERKEKNKEKKKTERREENRKKRRKGISEQIVNHSASKFHVLEVLVEL